MKLALALCVALLAVLLQAEHELSPPIRRAGTRFIPGTPATPGQFPFMAHIISDGRDGYDARYCAGSLITREAVLTEAFCILDFTKFTVRLGSVYATENDSNAWTDVTLWALHHPDYKESNFYSNLGIIYLTTKAPVNDYIKPVDLPSSPHVGTLVGCGGITIDWYKGILRYGEMIVIPNEVCEKFFKKGHVTDRSICAGSQSSIMFSAAAPLVIRNRGRDMQIGLYSECWAHANTSKPLLYTRVSSMIEWIRLKTLPNATKNARQRQSAPHPQPHI